jgi:hypothetical protein
MQVHIYFENINPSYNKRHIVWIVLVDVNTKLRLHQEIKFFITSNICAKTRHKVSSLGTNHDYKRFMIMLERNLSTSNQIKLKYKEIYKPKISTRLSD